MKAPIGDLARPAHLRQDGGVDILMLLPLGFGVARELGALGAFLGLCLIFFGSRRHGTPDPS